MKRLRSLLVLGLVLAFTALVVPDSSPLGRVLVLTDVNSVAPVHPTLESALGQ